MWLVSERSSANVSFRNWRSGPADVDAAYRLAAVSNVTPPGPALSLKFAAPLLLAAPLAGCDGPQSTLETAGRGAEVVAELWWVLLSGALVIWLLVIGLSVYAVYYSPRAHDEGKVRLLIIGGGAVVPTLVLAALLIYSLGIMPTVYPPIPESGPRVRVSGERWWWRIGYEMPDGSTIPLANEIRLPVGEATTFDLVSPDVIHSFWIPSLGGKIDMIPGRVNRMVLEPTRTGTFRGACAEYCGTSHALMNFGVVVMEKPDFEAWLAAQAAPAEPPAGPVEERGLALFLAYGCGACHAIRGTPADGLIGPDLTHVGGRTTLGAGILPNEPDDFAAWIARTHEIKPDVNMPSFGMLPDDEIGAIARYLDGLT